MSAKRIAVIGAGLGGMTAAGELARAGHRVTVFEAQPVVGGKAHSVHRGGLTFDAGPTLLTLPGVVTDTFSRLGAAELMPKVVEVDPQCEYRFPDGRRFVVHRDLERTVAQAEALAPGEGAALRRFYQDAEEIYLAAGRPYLEAPYEGLGALSRHFAEPGRLWSARHLRHLSLAALAASRLRSPHLRQFVGRYATYAGASPFRASPTFAMIAHLERAFGTHHVVGGMGALSAALGKVLARLGVRFVLGERAGWGQTATGFWAGPSGGEESFDSVVVNADPLASEGREHEPLSLSGFVLFFEASPKVALPHHTVLFSRDYFREFQQLFSGELPEDLTVYVCRPGASEPATREGREGLYVMVNAPPLSGRTEDRQLCTEQLQRLGESLPRLLEERLSAFDQVTLTPMGAVTPLDLANLGAPRGSIYGFLPHGPLAPLRRPRLRSGTPGLFYAGGGTHPGGGVPLVMLSGRFAAQLAADFLLRRAS